MQLNTLKKVLSSISFEKNQISYEEGKHAGDGYICYG